MQWRSLLWTLAAIMMAALLYPLDWRMAEVSADSVSGTMGLSVTCIAVPTQIFVPINHYEITTPLTDNRHCEAVQHPALLVNGDQPQSVACEAGRQRIHLHHITPTMKVAGLQCRSITAASLRATVDPMQGAGLDFTRPRDLNPAPPANPSDLLFGEGGRIGPMLRDGRDMDGEQNGEIAFGGDHEKTGGSRTHLYSDTSQDPQFPLAQYEFGLQ